MIVACSNAVPTRRGGACSEDAGSGGCDWARALAAHRVNTNSRRRYVRRNAEDECLGGKLHWRAGHAYAIPALHLFGKSGSAAADRGVLSGHRIHMTRKTITATSMSAALIVAVAFAAAIAASPVDAADPVEEGRFVWHDLLTKDVNAAKRFYGELFGWRFEDIRRGDRPYVLARLGG